MGGISAVIPAAGRGERLGRNQPKAFVELLGAPLLAWTLAAVEACPSIDEVIVVSPAEEIDSTWRMAIQYGFGKLSRVVTGGPDRQTSVLNGIEALSPQASVALVHDAARPLAPIDVMERCIAAATIHGSASAAITVADTLRHGRFNEPAGAAADRASLVRIQTPQAVRLDLVRSHLAACHSVAAQCTDDSSMVEQATGVPAFLVPGSEYSFKVTTAEDLTIAEALAKGGIGTKPIAVGESSKVHSEVAPFAIGFGFDVHRFDPSRPMMLAGIHIPGSAGLAGHSDADVALHAVCDAILGAIGERDIGYHFPNTGQEWADADSGQLLRRVVELAQAEGWAPLHVDVTVVAEQPQLSPHVANMRQRLGDLLGILPDRVAVKATTNEKMGFIGRGEGIVCFALATLQTRS